MDDMESTAALLLKQAQAERAAAAAQIEALAETRRAFEQRFDQAAGTLNELAAKLPNYAFAGGKQAVAALAGQALDNAAARIARAVAPVAKHEKDELAAFIASLKQSAAAREAAQEQSSRRWIGGAVTAMAAGFLFATFGVGWMVNDARAKSDAIDIEIGAKQRRLDNLNAVLPEAEKRAKELDSKGVRFNTIECLDDQGKKRLCVEVDEKRGRFASGEHTFYVVKGF